jgi:hypothetical protein
MSNKIKPIDYRIWVMKVQSKFGEKNIYFVPEGILAEWRNEKGKVVQEVNKKFSTLKKSGYYDFKLLFQPVKDKKPISMLMEIMKYVYWLEKECLKSGKNDLDISACLKFIKEYLGHLWAVI